MDFNALLLRPSVLNLLRRIVPAPLRRLAWNLHWKHHLWKARRGVLLEPDVSRIIKRYLKPGMTAMDIGANRGLISLLMADRVGAGGRVIAFEPYPPSVDAIHYVLESAQLDDRVQLVNKVVNDGGAEHVRLYFGRGESHSEINILGHDIDGHDTRAIDNADEIDAISIDAFLDSPGPIHLCKIDVEGAESQVLTGMRKTLERLHPTLIIEVHSPGNWRQITQLTRLGYRLLDLNERPLDLSAAFPARHVLAKAA